MSAQREATSVDTSFNDGPWVELEVRPRIFEDRSRHCFAMRWRAETRSERSSPSSLSYLSLVVLPLLCESVSSRCPWAESRPLAGGERSLLRSRSCRCLICLARSGLNGVDCRKFMQGDVEGIIWRGGRERGREKEGEGDARQEAPFLPISPPFL